MRRDPTADWAIGSANREWERMRKLALRIRESNSPVWLDRESWRFTGIFRRLLTDPIELLRKY